VIVMGTGAIGAYIGGRLQAAGAEVHFVGRPRVLQALRTGGLTLTDLDGDRVLLDAERLHLHERPPTRDHALALLCVKSSGTADAARALAAALPPGTPVLSLQNGVGNVPLAAASAPSLTWLRGMVPFNVAELAPGHWHRGMSGELAVERHAALRAWRPAFAAAGLPLAEYDDLLPVQWAKLLLNLNNPVNALSGLALRAQLLDRDCRVVTAALQAEALCLLHAAQIRPARITAVPPRWMPAVLRLPTPLFRLVAARSLRIDAQARSSMADDLARGRPTEIDALCGEVVRLARSLGRDAPRNQRMLELLSAPAPEVVGGRALRRLLGF
jgi:2-dehydropantoate 2-reductase